jgi:hypothetical protein
MTLFVPQQWKKLRESKHLKKLFTKSYILFIRTFRLGIRFELVFKVLFQLAVVQPREIHPGKLVCIN